MRKLSIVIVNYNVKHFLNQCLASISRSKLNGLTIDTWVVDNNSVDGSVEMLQTNYPETHLIVNNDNPGFAKANNQALRLILEEPEEGHFVLLLNPDTLVEEDTLQQCVDFAESHPDCGGISVKMINGEGRFLKESKRGFPSPEASFYKISGLIHLFPKHKRLAAYYMGHIDEDESGAIDVLPGAFILMSHKALNDVGLLDESYFMYGEDIDFSWRFKLKGYNNYYLPQARIVHYKGECTHKGSMNYVYTFYNAMSIFTKKYFNGKNERLFHYGLQAAIWMRASLAFVQRVVKHLLLPMFDFIVAFLGFYVIKQLWSTYRAANVNYYPDEYTWVILPLYCLLLLFAVFLCGGYDKPHKPIRIVKGLGLGACLLLLFYSLLDESMRYSRAIIVLGTVWTLLSTLITRFIINPKRRNQRILIIGKETEQQRVFDLIGQLDLNPQSVLGRTPETFDFHSHRLPQKANTLIFCSQDVSIRNIIDSTVALRNHKIDFRIAPSGTDVIIGPNYTNSPDDLYAADTSNSIATDTNKRSKRLVDSVSATILLLLSPILFWPQKRKRSFFKHCGKVWIGKMTWVGYSPSTPPPTGIAKLAPLPHLKPAVFSLRDRMPNLKNIDIDQQNRQYADNYTITTDLIILIRNIFNI